MKRLLCILFIFSYTLTKAQNAQGRSVKIAKPIITEEMENDTTGTYRVGIPPKKVLVKTNKNPNTTAGNTTPQPLPLKETQIQTPIINKEIPK